MAVPSPKAGSASKSAAWAPDTESEERATPKVPRAARRSRPAVTASGALALLLLPVADVGPGEL